MFVKGDRKEIKEMVVKFFHMQQITGPAIKGLPLSKEEKKIAETFEKDAEEVANVLLGIKTKHEKFWAGVKVRLDIFDKRLRYNPSTEEVEVIERE